MYKFRIVRVFEMLFIVMLFSFCSGCSNSPTLLSIEITPTNPSINTGTTQQFTANGTYSDNTIEDITSSVIWSSGTASVATISASGLATATSEGTSVITATLNSVSSTSNLTVDSSSLPNISLAGVYASGSTVDGENYFAVVWQGNSDGTLTAIDLSDPMDTNSTARSIFLGEDTIYAAGSHQPDGSEYDLPTIWEIDNGGSPVRTVLDFPEIPLETVTNGQVFSIYVSGTDVYSAGLYQYSDGAKQGAVLWKNAEAVDLNHTSDDIEAYSVYVIGTDAYVVGVDYASSVGIIWKVGEDDTVTEQELPNAIMVSSISGDGVKIFVAGVTDEGVPAIWIIEDGDITSSTKIELTDYPSTTPLSLHVNGTDLYLAGEDDTDSENTTPILWKIEDSGTGTITTISPSTGIAAHSICAKGTNVYAMGTDVGWSLTDPAVGWAITDNMDGAVSNLTFPNNAGSISEISCQQDN